MLTFEGKEVTTIECVGSFSLAQAKTMVPQHLTLEEKNHKAVLGLLYFQMHKLSAFGFGWPAFSYRELLWRIGILLDGKPAWFGVICELDDRLVQKSAEVMFQYTTTFSSFTSQDNSLRIQGEDSTHIQWTKKEKTKPPTTKRMLVARNGGLYEVFWRERPPSESVQLQVKIESSKPFDELQWEEGFYLQGRTHICGVAKKF